MIDYQDRQIELALREHLGGESPPDQAQAIVELALASANGRLVDSFIPDSAQGADESSDSHSVPHKQPDVLDEQVTSANVGVSKTAWIALASTAAVLIVGFFVWRVTSDRWLVIGSGPHQVKLTRMVSRDGLVMPQSTDTSKLMGMPMLRDGWVLTQPAVESMMVGVSKLEFQNARAIVRRGRVPDFYETALIERQLTHSPYVPTEGEIQMMTNPRHWIAGLGMAVCVLSGEALVGQETVPAAQAETASFDVGDVFDRFDLDGNGTLSMKECVCEHSKRCDINGDGVVKRKEFVHSVRKMAGSDEKFIEMVSDVGGVESFYREGEGGKHGRGRSHFNGIGVCSP